MNKTTKKVLSLALCLCMPLFASSALAEYADGSYTGVGTGMGGDVNVSVTVEGGKIVSVEVGEHNETPGISDPAIEQIPAAIVEAQSADVEAVSGATVTSNAIKEAVKAALSGEQAEEEGVVIPFEQPDVIVIGAGMAGLSSAVRASQLGANVLVFEQMPRIGGSAAVAGGSIVGAETIIEKEAGIEDSIDLLYADFGRLGGEGNYNPEVARKFAERAGTAVDWLDTFVGVNFGDRQPTYGSYEPLNVNRVHFAVPEDGDVSKSTGRGGSGFISALKAKLDEYIAVGNACLLLESPVTDIVIEDGTITGVVAQINGVETTIKAPSTIIATGGYGYCERWLKEFNFTNITSNDPNTAIGSGYDFARKAGAAFDNMNYSSCYGGSVPVTGFQASLRCNINYNGSVWINTNGDRVFNEPKATSMDKRTVWRTSDQNIIYVVFAENMMTEDKPLFTGMMSNSAPFTTEEKIAELIEKGYVFKADTIAELAEKIGTPNLEATLTKYDEDVAKGEDSVFGRTDNLLSFEEGPYYAVYTVPYLMMTAGGPRINGQGQLMREDGTAVGNVYLAGEIIGSANIAGHNTIGGIGHGICATWGCISAESAVQNAGK